jgi:hypothetical protein
MFMSIHTDSTRHIDFKLAQTVPDYWDRADRADFLDWARIWATDLLQARRLAVPEHDELTRIVLLAYQSGMLLTHATQACTGEEFMRHIDQFVISAASNLRRRKRQVRRLA